MDTPAKNARNIMALEVIKNKSEGMTIIDACDKVGMPRSTFYYTINHNPEFFIDVQETIKLREFENLLKILFNQGAILDKVIEDALAVDIHPRDRLKIVEMLLKMHDKLTKKLMLIQGNDQQAREYLTGVVQKKSQSRFNAYPTDTITDDGV